MDTLIEQYISQGRIEERRKLAQHLHDVMGGTVANVKLMLTHIQHTGNEALLGTCIEQLSELGSQVRTLSHELHDAIGNQADFITKLNLLCDTVRTINQMDIQLTGLSETTLPVQPARLCHLYFVMQQVLHNALTHAAATVIKITAVATASGLLIRIADNGQGCYIVKPGVGLQHIAERIALIGGTFSIDTAADKGFSLTINIHN